MKFNKAIIFYLDLILCIKCFISPLRPTDHLCGPFDFDILVRIIF